ncbi:MAG: histidinol-phosphatase HisJ family protein [Parasporobacterium sp.]|nr:histidinol-phosphatase HisJ family protein [Parasporobacterium sp.]
MLSDSHLHSRFSGDSQAVPEEVVQACIKAGMKHMCITDHQDLDFPEVGPFNKDSFVQDQPAYFACWEELREKYKGSIDIRIGLECGIEEHTAEEQLKRTKDVPYDFIINSRHVVSREIIKLDQYFSVYGTREAMDRYFEKVYGNLTLFPNFDVAGHLDFLLRFAADKTEGAYSYHADRYEAILKKVIELGKGIEINTAGYRKGMNGPNPCVEALKRYKELGGEIITVGSDAHTPSDVASRFDVAEALLKEIGFKYYCVFKERKPEFIKL